MPGLNQLKKFVENAVSLGDEQTVRKMRNETIEEIKIPEGISEANDSDDFLYGLPGREEENAGGAESVSTESTEEDIDIDALLAQSKYAGEANDAQQETSSAENTEEDIDIDALLAQSKYASEVNNAQTETFADDADSKTFTDAVPGFDSMVDLGELPDNEEVSVVDTSDTISNIIPETDIQDVSVSGDENADNFDLPDFSDMIADIGDDNMASGADNVTDVGDENFEMPGFDFDDNNSDSSVPDTSEPIDFSESPAKDTGFTPDTEFDGDIELPDFNFDDVVNSEKSDDGIQFDAADASDSSDTDLSMPDLSDMNFDVSSSENTSAEEEVDFSVGGDDNPIADNVTQEPQPDFNISDETNPDDSMFDIDTGSSSDDDFVIEGFSDVTAASHPKKEEKKHFSKTTETVQDDELTDEEYKKFIDNLNYYPLNLRVEIENMLIENQFNDDENIKVIRMVVKKTSVRQLANYVGKLLDKQISVPRNYEKRTAAQYEAYKSSAEYQLKNQILPMVFIGLLICMLGGSIFYLSKLFIYEPIRAEILYKEGYELIGKGYFQQSEKKFREAVDFKAKKKWFYTYAQGYRDKRQYGMAAQMYKWLLLLFPEEKNAGIKYAEMELYDLQHYAKAEEIVCRDLLDTFINDQESMLLLGDVYLEWATNEEPAKFEQARQMYETVMQMYGQTDISLARMLRYYIRTDNLREVLPLKSYFYPDKKSGPKKIKKLGAKDILELSTYLLNKLYGTLSPSEEYLRIYIEDVRDLLEQAILAEPASPEAFYNYACYFMHTANLTNAQAQLEKTLQVFAGITTSDPRLILKHIDTYRLLGELYKNQQEYLKAEELFTKGISLFEAEKEPSAIMATSDIGKLYSDLADIDYFISGDTDYALRNYERSVEYHNDTPSIRYRIGFIQYSKKNYLDSVVAFIKAAENKGSDLHLLLALGNALSLRDDNFAAQGYYERYMANFDAIKQQRGKIFPQAQAEDGELVENYMYATNNYGVALSKLAAQTGDSNLNAKAMVYLSEAMRAWDSLTRNQETLVRLEGSNLPAQNMKYLAYRQTPFEPALFFDIPRTLQDEEILLQPALSSGSKK